MAMVDSLPKMFTVNVLREVLQDPTASADFCRRYKIGPNQLVTLTEEVFPAESPSRKPSEIAGEAIYQQHGLTEEDFFALRGSRGNTGSKGELGEQLVRQVLASRGLLASGEHYTPQKWGDLTLKNGSQVEVKLRLRSGAQAQGVFGGLRVNVDADKASHTRLFVLVDAPSTSNRYNQLQCYVVTEVAVANEATRYSPNSKQFEPLRGWGIGGDWHRLLPSVQRRREFAYEPYNEQQVHAIQETRTQREKYSNGQPWASLRITLPGEACTPYDPEGLYWLGEPIGLDDLADLAEFN